MNKNSWKYIQKFGKEDRIRENNQNKSPKEITINFIRNHKRAFEELSK